MCADYPRIMQANITDGGFMDKYWAGVVGKCDACGGDFGKTMFDASVRGRWGNICQACFDEEGCSLGTGKGQQYRKTAEGRWLKVAG